MFNQLSHADYLKYAWRFLAHARNDLAETCPVLIKSTDSEINQIWIGISVPQLTSCVTSGSLNKFSVS